jgi:hypothetical protein
MTKTMKWILTGVASLAAASLLFAVPALARATGTDHRSMVATMHGGAMAPLMGQMPAMHDQVMGEIAKRLGLTPAELNQAIADGKSITDLANERNVSPDEVLQIMTEGMRSLLDQAVEAGTITQEQADQMLQFHAQHSAGCLSVHAGNMMSMHDMMFGSKDR